MQNQSNSPEAETNGLAAAPTAARLPAGVSGEFRSFIADVEDLIRATTPMAGEDLTRARAKLDQRIAAARESIAGISGDMADQARRVARTTNGYVHENPWQAVGIGAALGLLLGVVLARRK